MSVFNLVKTEAWINLQIILVYQEKKIPTCVEVSNTSVWYVVELVLLG